MHGNICNKFYFVCLNKKDNLIQLLKDATTAYLCCFTYKRIVANESMLKVH